MNLKRTLFFLGFLLFAANLVSVASIQVLTDLTTSPDLSDVRKAIQESGSLTVISQYAPFPIVVILLMIFFKPLFSDIRKKNTAENLSIVSKNRLLMSPMMLSILGAFGWVTGMILFASLAPVYTLVLPIKYIVFSILISFVLGSITFVITYYGTEYYLRKYIVPFIFPGGQLDQLQSMAKLSVRARLFIFFFAVVTLPMVVFLQVMLNLNNDGINVFNKDISIKLFILCGVVVILAFIITMMKSSAIQNPLLEIRQAIKRISGGDFSVKLLIQSTDEIGELAQGVNEMALELSEKEKLRDIFGRVVDPAIRDHLMKNEIQLGGSTRNVSILFSDLQGFTAISEHRDSVQIVNWLNEYFDRMTQSVMRHGGIVNKYIGDAIMAVFGAPLDLENHQSAAFLAGREMLEIEKELNESFRLRNLPEVHTRIGIHSGDVLAGNIGASVRIEYTVIGDTVNTASRLEALCKKLNTRILFSDSVFNALSDELSLKYSPKYLGKVNIRGRENSLRVYTMDIS